MVEKRGVEGLVLPESAEALPTNASSPEVNNPVTSSAPDTKPPAITQESKQPEQRAPADVVTAPVSAPSPTESAVEQTVEFTKIVEGISGEPESTPLEIEGELENIFTANATNEPLGDNG